MLSNLTVYSLKVNTAAIPDYNVFKIITLYSNVNLMVLIGPIYRLVVSPHARDDAIRCTVHCSLMCNTVVYKYIISRLKVIRIALISVIYIIRNCFLKTFS